MRRHVWAFAAGLAVLAACGDQPDPTAPDLSAHVTAGGAVGAVYVMSNATDGNSLLVYRRSVDGTLEPAGSVASGGAGTGAGLGNQGGLVASADGRWLFAVNAGDNSISSFVVRPGGPVLASNVPSGGERPLSLAQRGRLLYVLNGGGAGAITGFRIRRHGVLEPIPGSTRPLSQAGPGPAEVAFSPNGRVLIVTEKATNRIVTYLIGQDGLPGQPQPQPSAGMTPFGFAFTPAGALIVSEAFGGAPDASAASSYRLGHDGSLSVVSASVGTTETAACWVAVTNDGRFAYTTNTGSSSISGYRVSPFGALQLLDADGVTGETGTGSSPIDLSLSRDGQFLYALSGGTSTVTAFRIRHDGGLESLATYDGLPAGANGLVAQ